MMRLAGAWIVSGSLAMAAPCYAAAGADAPPPNTGATEAVQPAPPPAKPAGSTGGFPVLAIPAAILIGVGAALATGDDNAQFPASTTTR